MFIRESSSIGCLQCSPPSPSVQSEANAAMQSCQYKAALRNRAEPSALACYPLSGRSIHTHTQSLPLLECRVTPQYRLRLLTWKWRCLLMWTSWCCGGVKLPLRRDAFVLYVVDRNLILSFHFSADINCKILQISFSLVMECAWRYAHSLTVVLMEWIVV